MEKIPTAEEFLKLCIKDPTEIEVKLLKEFAELHVKAALKAANKRRKKQDWIDNHINLKEHACTKAILSAYPLTNIQ